MEKFYRENMIALITEHIKNLSDKELFILWWKTRALFLYKNKHTSIMCGIRQSNKINLKKEESLSRFFDIMISEFYLKNGNIDDYTKPVVIKKFHIQSLKSIIDLHFDKIKTCDIILKEE